MAQLLTILPGATDSDKLQALAETNYKQQVIWFLNAFWDTLGNQAEDLWKYMHKYADLDLEKKADGNGLVCSFGSFSIYSTVVSRPQLSPFSSRL